MTLEIGTLFAVLYAMINLLAGFFLRDAYNYVKRKYIKGDKPKMTIGFDVAFSSSHGTNPRIYNFRRAIKIQNIDTLPIYDVEVVSEAQGQNQVLFCKNFLAPSQSEELKHEKEVRFGDSGNVPNEAFELLPEAFKNPKLTLKYKDKNGHKFKQKPNSK